MSMYQLAVLSIRNKIQAKQAILDAEAASARAAFAAALAKSLAETDDETQIPVAALASATITVGREDGYPAVNIPQSTRNALLAAWHAGVIANAIGGVCFHKDFSGYSQFNSDLGKLWQADYAAWLKAGHYRRDNAAADSL